MDGESDRRRPAAAIAATGAIFSGIANRLVRRRGRNQTSTAGARSGPGARADTTPDAPEQVPSAPTAEGYFVDSLEFLAGTYRDTPFWTERDIVYVLQRQLADRLQRQPRGWRVFNGQRINPGEKPAVSADLAIVAPSGEVTLGAEFKYEPCHRRPDIAKGKFPVAVWTDVVKDTVRADRMVERGAVVAMRSVSTKAVGRRTVTGRCSRDTLSGTSTALADGTMSSMCSFIAPLAVRPADLL